MSSYVKQSDAIKAAETAVKDREKTLVAENEIVINHAKEILAQIKEDLDNEAVRIKDIKRHVNNTSQTLSAIINRRKCDIELTSVSDVIAECDDAFAMRYTEDIMPEDEESGLELLQEKKTGVPYYQVLAYARNEYVVLRRRHRNIIGKDGSKGKMWVWDKGYKDSEVLCWSELPPIPKKRRKKPEEKTE